MVPGTVLVLTHCLQSRAPAQLIYETITTATQFASGQVLTGTATLLTEGVLRTLMLKKLAVFCTLFLAAGGMTLVAGSTDFSQESALVAKNPQSARRTRNHDQRSYLAAGLYPPEAIARLGTERQRAPGAQLAITADGKEIVTVDHDLIIRRFNAANGELLVARQLPTKNFARLGKLSPRGKFVLMTTFPSTGLQWSYGILLRKRFGKLSPSNMVPGPKMASRSHLMKVLSPLRGNRRTAYERPNTF